MAGRGHSRQRDRYEQKFGRWMRISCYKKQQIVCGVWYISQDIIGNKFGRLAWDLTVNPLQCPAKGFGFNPGTQALTRVQD